MGKKEPAGERRIPAGEFKAKCLALLDEVAETGATLVITKRGKPVAKVVPADTDGFKSLRGSILWEGDIVSPMDEPWNAETAESIEDL